MSFKLGLFLVIFALTSCVRTQSPSDAFTPSGDECVQSEVRLEANSKDVGENRRKCWENGGVAYNRENSTDLSQARTSAVKIMESDDKKRRTVFNYGSQFESKSFDGDIQSLGIFNDRKTRWLTFKKDLSKWDKDIEDNLYCQRILHYKCLHDMVINTTKSLAEANELKCSEFHGDLVIAGLGYSFKDLKPDLSFIKEIQKIRGRLYIVGVLSELRIDFPKLAEVGTHLENKTAPFILIDANSMQNLTLPELDLDGCYNVTKKCMHVAFNIQIKDVKGIKDFAVKTKKQTVMDGDLEYIRYGYEKHTDKIGNEAIPKEEKMKIHNENDLKKRGWSGKFDDWEGQTMNELPIVHFPFIFIVVVGVAGVIGVGISGCLKYMRADVADVVKEFDDKEFIEVDEDYFKVDNNANNNNNNNKNSAMDDLGSL